MGRFRDAFEDQEEPFSYKEEDIRFDDYDLPFLEEEQDFSLEEDLDGEVEYLEEIGDIVSEPDFEY